MLQDCNNFYFQKLAQRYADMKKILNEYVRE